jgi:hypothetical protein
MDSTGRHQADCASPEVAHTRNRSGSTGSGWWCSQCALEVLRRACFRFSSTGVGELNQEKNIDEKHCHRSPARAVKARTDRESTNPTGGEEKVLYNESFSRINHVSGWQLYDATTTTLARLQDMHMQDRPSLQRALRNGSGHSFSSSNTRRKYFEVYHNKSYLLLHSTNAKYMFGWEAVLAGVCCEGARCSSSGAKTPALRDAEYVGITRALITTRVCLSPGWTEKTE